MQTRRSFLARSAAATSALARSAVAASALTVGAAAPAFGAESGADLIFRGGTIRPLAGAPVASALTVKDATECYGRFIR